MYIIILPVDVGRSCRGVAEGGERGATGSSGVMESGGRLGMTPPFPRGRGLGLLRLEKNKISKYSFSLYVVTYVVMSVG